MTKGKKILLNLLYGILSFLLICGFAYLLLLPGIPRERITEDGSTVTVLRLPNAEYTGESVLGFLNGQGVLTFDTGEIYEGDFKNHKFEGNGKLTVSNGTYEGEFEKSCRSGNGTFTWSDGGKYTGAWENDKMNGDGEMVAASGTTYKGVFADNALLTGTIKGKIDNVSFSIEVNSGALSNEIHVKFDDGVTYDGEFDGKSFSGEGVMTFPEIGSYEGYFKNDKRDGYGVFTWLDGAHYDGNWTNDVYDGTGKYYFDSSTYLSGVFDKGKLDGTYTYTTSDGFYSVKWENGKCTSIKEK